MTAQMTILFADVAGSVALHERLGDHEAHRIVVQCLDAMSEVVKRCQGRVVEIIGDEIMSLFRTPEAAFAASRDMQVMINEGDYPGIRIGFHTGAAAFDKGHPYGDTVNVAARLAGLAHAGQIVISEAAQQQLSTESRANTRYFDRKAIKGKSLPYQLYEVLWGDVGNQTVFIRSVPDMLEEKAHALNRVTLTYRNQEILLTQEDGELVIGRTPECRIQVPSHSVSRTHLTIRFDRGKVMLQDRSTNGTYIRTQTGPAPDDYEDSYLHREEWPLQGKGILGLGQPIQGSNEYLVYFRCE